MQNMQRYYATQWAHFHESTKSISQSVLMNFASFSASTLVPRAVCGGCTARGAGIDLHETSRWWVSNRFLQSSARWWWHTGISKFESFVPIVCCSPSQLMLKAIGLDYSQWGLGTGGSNFSKHFLASLSLFGLAPIDCDCREACCVVIELSGRCRWIHARDRIDCVIFRRTHNRIIFPVIIRHNPGAVCNVPISK